MRKCRNGSKNRKRLNQFETLKEKYQYLEPIFITSYILANLNFEWRQQKMVAL